VRHCIIAPFYRRGTSGAFRKIRFGGDAQTAHEEILAGNEELESLNEELESAKEELEATNEELVTINQELHIRNDDLEQAGHFAQSVVDTVRTAIVVLSPSLRVLKANLFFYREFHLSAADVQDRYIYELDGGHWADSRLRQLLAEVLKANRSVRDFEVQYSVPSRGLRTLVVNAYRFEAEERILLSIEDVTDVRRAEEQLRQSQKMEAMGYLAAGIAHDFNNLLTGIMGSASLLLEDMPAEGTARSDVQVIVSGAERAAELTRQLLAYAGKSRYYLERLSLTEMAIQTSRLVNRSIPDRVQLRLDLDKHLPLLLADPSQIQQVVMNLIINAAEAIGDAGGAIRLRTGVRTLTSEPLPDSYLTDAVAPGDYVSGGSGQRLRNGRADDSENLRSVLHDQVYGPGSWSVGSSGDCQAA